MAGMTSQGSALTRYRRAIRSGNPTLALAAAAELTTMSLEDALLLCLVLIRARDRRAGAAVVRWHARYSLEVRPAPDESQLLFAALRALGGPAHGAAVQTLGAVFGQSARPQLARTLESVT
jgi:hypothetical protein